MLRRAWRWALGSAGEIAAEFARWLVQTGVNRPTVRHGSICMWHVVQVEEVIGVCGAPCAPHTPKYGCLAGRLRRNWR